MRPRIGKLPGSFAQNERSAAVQPEPASIVASR